jgi:hypothetical protein
MLTGVLREGATQQNSVEAAAFQARKFQSCSAQQTDERLGHLRRVPLPGSGRARARCHVDHRFRNKLGDRIVSVGDPYLDQGGFISRLHDLNFLGAEGTVRNQFLDRHRGSPEKMELRKVSASAYTVRALADKAQ